MWCGLEGYYEMGDTELLPETRMLFSVYEMIYSDVNLQYYPLHEIDYYIIARLFENKMQEKRSCTTKKI